jgi:beta-galactosidase
MRCLITILFLIYCCMSFAQNSIKMNLNGTWQIAEGRKNNIPAKFERTIRVPGLITLAKPAFDHPAPRFVPGGSLQQKDSLREAYWYRRTFVVDENIPAVATLKISKAMYGTRVYVNGQYIGEHLPCFTPGYFDIREALHKGENELIISVGSCTAAIPLSIPNGFDFEKQRYIPGIYDNVSLKLSGTPDIINVQAVPDILHKVVKVRVYLENRGKEEQENKLSIILKEVKSGKVAGILKTDTGMIEKNSKQICDITVPIKNCRLWSPESPFLYELEVKTIADVYKTRFGMREFRFDSVSKRAMLNGKTCFMRGSNITLYRFFEDQECKDLPWNKEWIRTLHQRFKDFHWNCLRYCIGLAPEEWYDIADEVGILIQDEFPIWYGGTGWSSWTSANLKSDELAEEFKEWMEESWNHPSVVIWDASNETRVQSKPDEMALAVNQVRSLDLSDRPWDNSFSSFRKDGDVFESHPYHFQDENFKLKDLAKSDIVPGGNELPNTGKYPVIINEYGWLWLNRDGSPTTLTKKLYENLLGKNSTVEQRRKLYAHLLACETEFWRCHRQAAGVLHFTALGYSRPDGQTSDHWENVEKLTWEKEFYKQVRDAFSPVAVMIDFWDDTIPQGEIRSISLKAINDLDKDWRGSVSLRILKNGEIILQKSCPILIRAYGSKDLSFVLKMPSVKGKFSMEAVLLNTPFGTVKSIREFNLYSKK